MRYLKKIAAKIAALKSAVVNILSIFLGDKKGKEKKMVTGVTIFRGGNWLIILATCSFVTLLVGAGLSYFPIFMILWIGNMVLSTGLLWANEKTKIDFTSMEGFRNILQKAFEKSKMAGYLAEVGMFFFLLIWEGPEQFIIFFEDKFSSKKSKWLILGLVSFTYVTVWTLILVGLADGFWDLVPKIF